MLIRLLIFSTLVLAVNLVAGIFAKDQSNQYLSLKDQHQELSINDEGKRPRISMLLRGTNRHIDWYERQRGSTNLLRKPKITKRFAKEEWNAEVDERSNLTRLASRRRSLHRDEVQRTDPQPSSASIRRIHQRPKPVERSREILEAEESAHGLPIATTFTATGTGQSSTPVKANSSEELIVENNAITENNINLEARGEIENGTLAQNGTISGKDVRNEHTETSESLLKANTTARSEIFGAHSISTPHRKRRPSAVIRSDTPASPLPVAAALTMSQSLYNHFRPLDQEVPEDHILPFLDFGKKLVPGNAKATSPVDSSSSTSSTNSIEAFSTSTQTPTLGQNNLLSTKPQKFTSSSTRLVHVPREDEIHEDMDVSVVKSVVEKNKASRSRGGSLQFLINLGGLYRKHETAHDVAGNISSVTITPAPSLEKNGLETEQAAMNYTEFDGSRGIDLEAGENISTNIRAVEDSSNSDGGEKNAESLSLATTERPTTPTIKNYTDLSPYRQISETTTNGNLNPSSQNPYISKSLAESSTSQSSAPAQLSASSTRTEAIVAIPYERGRSSLMLRNMTSFALPNRRQPSTYLHLHRHSNALFKISKPFENTSIASESFPVSNENKVSPEHRANLESISVTFNLEVTTSSVSLQTQPEYPDNRTGRVESINFATLQSNVSELIAGEEKIISNTRQRNSEWKLSTKTNERSIEQTVQNVGSNVSSQMAVESVTGTSITNTSPQSSHSNITLPTKMPFITSSVPSPTTKILSTAVVTSVSVKGVWPVMITEPPPLKPTLVPPQSYGSQNTEKEPVENVLESPGRYGVNRNYSNVKEPTTNKTHDVTFFAITSLPPPSPSNAATTHTISGDLGTSTDRQAEGNVVSNNLEVTTTLNDITSNSTKNITSTSIEYEQNNTRNYLAKETRVKYASILGINSTEEGNGSASGVIMTRRDHDDTARVGTPKTETTNTVTPIYTNRSDPPMSAPKTPPTQNLTRTLPELVTRQADEHSTSIPVTIKSPESDVTFDFPLLKLYNTSAVWAVQTRGRTEKPRKSSTEYTSTGNGSTTVTSNTGIMEASTHKVIVTTKGIRTANNTGNFYKGESRNEAVGQVGKVGNRQTTDADVRNSSNFGVNLLLGDGGGLSRNNATVGNHRPVESGARAHGVSVVVYVVSALGIVPLAIGVAFVARYCVRRRRKLLDDTDTCSDISSRKGGHSGGGHTGSDVGSPVSCTKLPRVQSHVSWDQEKVIPTAVQVSTAGWEFPRSKLRLQTVLGQGNFGQVLKAEADDIRGHEGTTRLVAVKTVKDGASSREKQDLLRELEIMQQLGSHANVVTLLGCCTEKEPYLLIMEYVMYGKLLAFLRDHRTRQHYYNFSEDSDALTSRDLTIFAYCVARGMEYLGSKGIIHRDLAARNVLVDHNKMCKIADFGMSRSVRETGDTYEQRHTKGALPIRWMAPESLHYRIFTHKSDVWSYGILMWEVVTLGSTPYPTMGAREVMRRVWDGYRLERPSHCRSELFRVISKCWNADPNKRPDFTLLRCEIGALIEASQDGGGYVDLESFAESNKSAYSRSDDQSHPYHHNHQHHPQSTSAVLASRSAGEIDTVHM